MPLTLEQFKSLKENGFTTEEIIELEKEPVSAVKPILSFPQEFEKSESLINKIDILPFSPKKVSYSKELLKGGLEIAKGVGKKAAETTTGFSSLMEKGIRALLPKSVETVLEFPEKSTTARELVPKELTEPKGIGQQIGSTGLSLAVLFASTPFKGLGLPNVIANSSKYLKGFNTVLKFGTKGAMEFGTKEAILTGGDLKAVERATLIGVAGELLGVGFGGLLKKAAPATVPLVEKVLKPLKPILKKPTYIPKPRISPENMEIPQKYLEQGVKMKDLLVKNNFQSKTVNEVFLEASDKIKKLVVPLNKAIGVVKEKVDIKPILETLEKFIKNQKKIGMTAKAKFAKTIKRNIEYSSKEVLQKKKMSLEEIVQWRRLFDKAVFKDPAVAEIAQESFKNAGNSARNIINKFPKVAKLDEQLTEIYDIQNAMRQGLPKVDKAMSQYEKAIEKAVMQAMQDNARMIAQYEEKMGQYNQRVELAIKEEAIKGGLPSGWGPKQLTDFARRINENLSKKGLRISPIGVEGGRIFSGSTAPFIEKND